MKKSEAYQKNCDFVSDEMCEESLEEIGIDRDEAEFFEEKQDSWE
jgi:hypothetical protein